MYLISTVTLQTGAGHEAILVLSIQGESNAWKTSLYTSKIEMHSGYFLISFIDLTWILFKSALTKGRHHLHNTQSFREKLPSIFSAEM